LITGNKVKTLILKLATVHDPAIMKF
jgi:hypothetical protein